MRHKPPREKSQQKNLNSLKVKMMKLARNQKTRSRIKRRRPRKRRNWSRRKRLTEEFLSISAYLERLFAREHCVLPRD